MTSKIFRNKELNIWTFLSFIAVLLIVIPSINIFINLASAPNENWYHIKEFLLKKYFMNTLVIVLGTGFLTTFIGISLAWIMTIYDFPFKKFMKWGLCSRLLFRLILEPILIMVCSIILALFKQP